MTVPVLLATRAATGKQGTTRVYNCILGQQIRRIQASGVLLKQRQGTRDSFVKVVEVGPRDGLQNEKAIVPLETKVALINKLSKAGFTSVEAGAFVSPKWVPQMADSGKVMQLIDRSSISTEFPVLVPNLKGLNLAIDAGATEVAIFGAASEEFSRKNINCSISESLERFRAVARAASDRGVAVRGYVSCVVGCPYEGSVDPKAVRDVAKELDDMGCYNISLGDTIGVGTPGSILRMFEAVTSVIPIEKLAIHCHDTYGQALANIYTSLQAGIRVVDSSVSGLGGCPFAKGATGNVASEDVIYMLHGLGYETGVDLNAVAQIGAWISKELGRPNLSRAGAAILAKSVATPLPS